MIAQNRAALAGRFPELLEALERAPSPGPVAAPATPRPTLSVAGLQLASGYDPEGEAALQAALVPRDARSATCYGIGTGFLPRALLARPALKRLDVVLFHAGVARVADHPGEVEGRAPRAQAPRRRALPRRRRARGR